ncbi:MAG: chromate transporter [Eggerthellaceae bacterium]|nr:chromate transporter [Eggerthellaceae bacterium]
MPKTGKNLNKRRGSKKQWGEKPGCLRLFFAFIKIGLMTFSGYAILPIIQRELIDSHGWLTEEQARYYFAIGQATPGLVAINMSTCVGCSLHGVVG